VRRNREVQGERKRRNKSAGGRNVRQRAVGKEKGVGVLVALRKAESKEISKREYHYQKKVKGEPLGRRGGERGRATDVSITGGAL